MYELLHDWFGTGLLTSEGWYRINDLINIIKISIIKTLNNMQKLRNKLVILCENLQVKSGNIDEKF